MKTERPSEIRLRVLQQNQVMAELTVISPDFREIQTGLVAFGPGIKKGGVIPVMNVRDIEPAGYNSF